MVTSTSDRIDLLFFRLVLFVSIAVTLSLPVISGYIAYQDLEENLGFKAQIKAKAQKEMITTLPQTWMFAQNRMQGILTREPVLLENEFVQIYDNQGNELTSAGEPVKSFPLRRSYPLYDIDQIVGKVVVSSSLYPVIHNIIISSIFGLFLGSLVLGGLWFLPVKQLRQLSAALSKEKQQAETTLQSIRDGVFRTDEKGRLVYLNAAAEELVGRTFAELANKPMSEILTLVEEQTHSEVESSLYQAIHTEQYASLQGNYFLISSDNREIAVEEQAIPLFNENGKLTGSVLCISDVTVVREQLKKQSWEASHDVLTGLINRREFEKRVAQAIVRAQVAGGSGLVCFMDIDGFKIVNDTCGHAAGDEMLIQLSEIIGAQVRNSDSLARFGGDEFGLLLERCDEDRGQIIVNNILNSVSEFYFFHDGKVYTVGISIGMTSFSSENYNVRDVINEADCACYWAKESGRHRLCIFRENKAELTARRTEVSWVERIRSAFDEDRFVLYYQTYQALNDRVGSRQHMEILLRMVSESGKIIQPGSFLPAAERYNLMPEIDKWVIDKLFSEFHNIPVAAGASGLMVNINLSGASINSAGLYDYIKEKVAEYDIDTSSLCFEITETVAVRNLRVAIDFMHQCRKIGIQFALDDFGSGANFFQYLKNMPVDYLKIDGSFVKNIDRDELNREMVRTINSIGHLLGKKTIAEYAESETIIEILGDIDIDFAQGFGVCNPKPLIAA